MYEDYDCEELKAIANYQQYELDKALGKLDKIKKLIDDWKKKWGDKCSMRDTLQEQIEEILNG